MATTAVAVLFTDKTTALAHVGDSRAYLFRSEALTRLTQDHSWVEEQVQAGLLSESAAREHPWRNIVTRALSGGETVDVEVTDLELQRGDRLILCSDGLSSVLTDTAIRDIVACKDREEVCDELVRLVNERGAPDNVTTLVLDIDAG
jgi:protein phosphatase